MRRWFKTNITYLTQIWLSKLVWMRRWFKTNITYLTQIWVSVKLNKLIIRYNEIVNSIWIKLLIKFK